MHHDSIKPRINFTLAVTAFAILHLSLEMATGGVRAHYPLQREDMPALSNWWGLVLLPALAWLSHWLMEKDYSATGILGLKKVAVYRLACAFLYGALIGATFELELGESPLYLLFGLLLGGVAYPLYRIEVILGIVLGMTYTFGAVIPTVVTSLVALTSWVSYNSARFVLSKLRLRKT